MTSTVVLETPPAIPEASLPPNRESLLALGRLSRVLGRAGGGDGPTLVVLAGIHGNEPCGVLALDRVFRRLGAGRARLGGRLVGLAGNLAALAEGRRYLDEDLNRIWRRDRVERLRSGEPPVTAEERELAELDREIQAVLSTAVDPVYVLDLHSVSGPGLAFTVLDDTLPNRAFALEMGVPMVLGIEEELPATVTHYLSRHAGVVGAGFEGGQHEDPVAVDRCEAAVWVALQVARLLPAGAFDHEAERSRRLLAAHSGGLPRVVEVRDRHAITPQDRFEILPGLAGFQPVARGQVLAHDRRGEVRSREAGLLLMPLYQPQGDDGFFLVRPVRPVWLRVSEALRRLSVDRRLHWLPGIARHPERPDGYLVDQRWARFGALGFFHLLGYRREGPKGRILTMARRSGDSRGTST